MYDSGSSNAGTAGIADRLLSRTEAALAEESTGLGRRGRRGSVLEGMCQSFVQRATRPGSRMATNLKLGRRRRPGLAHRVGAMHCDGLMNILSGKSRSVEW